MNRVNGPTPDAAARDVTLSMILKNHVTLEIFKDQCLKDHNAENLMLYLDIRQYKQTSDAPLRSMLAREIFDTFVQRGSRYEVNVSDVMRRQLEKTFALRPGMLSPASVSTRHYPHCHSLNMSSCDMVWGMEWNGMGWVE
jgi:hypothetical protein